MIKKIFILILSLFLLGCSYFQVKDAIKEADKGNYIASLNNLLSILKENSEDRRALDAFEIIYPTAEKRYYDEVSITKMVDIVGYTKALLNLLRVQEIYYDLPQISKESIAVIEPPIQERNVIKKELAESFYTLGTNMRSVTYEEKLRIHGYFAQAKNYDLENRKDINSKYDSSRKEALGRFLLNFTGEERGLIGRLKENLIFDLNNYSLFSLGNSKDFNLKFDINVSEIIYSPPRITTYSGIDSYTERVIKRVMEKRIETKIVNGEAVQVERWVPVEKEVEIEVYYRYFKHVKTTSMEYNLSHNLSEKNGTHISSGNKKIFYEDNVAWVEYYPLHPFIGERPFRFPVSEYEKPVMSKSELREKILELGSKNLDDVLGKLDSNRIIDW